MQIQELAREYQSKTDEELLQLAEQREQLTAEARSVLAAELAKRRIDSTDHLKVQDQSDQGGMKGAESRGYPSHPKNTVGEFIAEVLSIHRARLWFFVQFTGPAVMVGYLAMMLGRNEGREIAGHLPRGVAILDHPIELLEIWLANTAGYFVSWMASCFSFGAICAGVGQITAGETPSTSHSLAVVRERIGPIWRLSLLLFVLLMVGVTGAGLLGTGIFWVLHQSHYRYGAFTIWTTTFALFGLMLLVLSRFGLAIPALVLDDRGLSKAMFRSDELTEGKWVTLALLLAKSLIVGYVAGMLPFWLTRWAWAYVQLPWWLPVAGSIAAVSVVEPFMFIGFALLFVRMSESSPASREAPVCQFS